MANLTDKVVTYVRVASKVQAEAGYSLELQREKLRKYAEENNLEIVKEFSDIAPANDVYSRKGFNEMTKFIRDFEDSENKLAILVTQIDRITIEPDEFRSLLPFYMFVTPYSGWDHQLQKVECFMAFSKFNFLKDRASEWIEECGSKFDSKGDKEDENN